MSTAVGPNSTRMICPSCNADISTSIERKSTSRTHTAALLLCLFCTWVCCCCCIPYCMNSCRNVNHYCPNCHAFLGVYTN